MQIVHMQIVHMQIVDKQPVLVLQLPSLPRPDGAADAAICIHVDFLHCAADLMLLADGYL